LSLEERITRGKAIRLKCLDCCCGSASEVRRCESRKCPLWRFRMGREVLEDSEEDAAEFEAGQTGQAPAHPKREQGEK
jgi:hypothetical protein